MAKKVVVAMSGGVDSSVAAALLKDRGYDVTGITLRLADWESTEGRTFGGCCGSRDFYDARRVAQTLGIPHYSFDYVDRFRVSVIEYFKDSYLKGETPNPCIACNKHIKFDVLLKQAAALGANFLATGHYARIGKPSRRTARAGSSYFLKKAIDPAKDQSYVLYHLSQEELSRLLFPLGELTKTEVRRLARRYHLCTADKPDSQEICFVPNQDYRRFIEVEVPAAERLAGAIRHEDGRWLGEHRGLPYYTIGQREGLGVSVGHPLYVTRIDTGANTLVVGEKEHVLAKGIVVREVSWVSGRPPTLPCHATVKIRYKHAEASATIERSSAPVGQQVPGTYSLVFDQPQAAATPGQAAVFYNKDRVLGGGVIDHGIRGR